jgi:protein tyrosine phosphatase
MESTVQVQTLHLTIRLTLISTEIEFNDIGHTLAKPSLLESKYNITFINACSIIVETVGEEHSQDIVTREIMILNTKQTGKKRKIHFFQYTGWPDMGVPQSVETILTLVETVDTLHSKYPNAPILTHCR